MIYSIIILLGGQIDKPNDIKLCRNFHHVVSLYHRLDVKYQYIIQQVTNHMGNCMADYANKPIKTIHDYDEYCHHVAGIVGIGLSQMFITSGLQPSSDQLIHPLSNSMGLFLQKTNIIRDYHEDIILEYSNNRNARIFWPSDIWSLYTNDICSFVNNSNVGLMCLNHMVCDALSLVPHCLMYLKLIQDEKIFNFCAIPQVMAIATLNEVFNNKDVFNRNVKIRKGTTCKVRYKIL